jgi:hypothetical protein
MSAASPAKLPGLLMGCPFFVVICALELAVKYNPGCESIKLWQLHHNAACPFLLCQHHAWACTATIFVLNS